jgi:ribonuclease P protein component
VYQTNTNPINSREDSGELVFPGSATFPRQEHLKKRSDIRQVFKKGLRKSVKGAVLFYKPNGLEHNRIAFTFSAKFGIAVERNRARRLGREAWRHLSRSCASAYDLVLLVYPGDLGFRDRYAQLKGLLKRAGLTKGLA